jgi:hypothetical protein
MDCVVLRWDWVVPVHTASNWLCDWYIHRRSDIVKSVRWGDAVLGIWKRVDHNDSYRFGTREIPTKDNPQTGFFLNRSNLFSESIPLGFTYSNIFTPLFSAGVRLSDMTIFVVVVWRMTKWSSSVHLSVKRDVAGNPLRTDGPTSNLWVPRYLWWQ